MHPLLYLAIAVLFIVGAVLAFTSIKTTDNKNTTTPAGSQKNTITFTSNPNIDYSSTNNNEKSFTFGTFTSSVVLSNISFSFNVEDSVFTNASVNLILSDSNNDDYEFYKETIDNFITSPIEFQIDNIIIPKDTKLILKLNGDIKLFRPNVSFTYKLPDITISPIIPTTMMPTTMMPTTIQNIVFKPINNNTSLSVNNDIQNFSMGTLPIEGTVKNIILSYNPSSTISPDSYISVEIFNQSSPKPLHRFTTEASNLNNPNSFVLNDYFNISPGQTVSIQLNGSNITLLNPVLSINVETSSVIQPTTMTPMQPTTMMPMKPTTMMPMQPTTMMPMQPTTMMPTSIEPNIGLPTGLPF